MDTILELAVGILGFAGAIVAFRLLKPKSVAKENQAVIVKVDNLEKKNEDVLKELASIVENANKQAAELEKEKNKKLTEQETEDFFNNRNKLQ